MGANWNKPTTSSLYDTEVLPELKSRDEDAGTLFNSIGSNLPVAAIRYLRASNKFQEWDGAAWNDKVLALAGGGTGAATASGARSSLGLGTIATQDSNNVTITGGAISGLASLGVAGTVTATLFSGSGASLTTLNASNLSSGNVPVARLPVSGTWTLTGRLYLDGSVTKVDGLEVAQVTIAVGDSPYTIDNEKLVVFANAAGGNITVNLPAANTVAGKLVEVKKIDSSTNTVTVDPNTTETIDGSLTLVIQVQYEAYTLQSDGTNWFIL